MHRQCFTNAIKGFLTSSLLTSLVFLLVPQLGQAQRSDASQKEKLAIQYYQNEKYQKALPLFEELFEANPGSGYLYEYYLNTMLKAETYEQAIGMLEAQTDRYPQKLTYRIALGYVQEQKGNPEKAKSTYERVLDNLAPRRNKLKTVANTFRNRGKLNYAIQTYKKGRKLINEKQAFSLQLARLYRESGSQQEAMFQAYLDAFQLDAQSEDIIKNELQKLVMNDAPFRNFKSILLKRIRDNPGERRLIDLLSWVFIQNQAFDEAFTQLRALQKRLETNGQRLLELASVARKNQALGTAEQVYRYLIDLGPDNPYYFRARQGVLEVQYDRIVKLQDYDQSDVIKLEKGYQGFMSDERFSYADNGKVTLRLAKLKAIYLDEINEAIDLLQNLINEQAGGNRSLKAKARLALADYYLLKGQHAKAQLTYAKVENMFEGHPLGNKATFRKAKLSFYKGNFDWAGSQLKILKGATSKMIANNALELDMLIKDNRGLDTTEVPLQIYARADMYLFKNQYEEAQLRLDSILTQFPEHNLTDEVYFAKARIAKKNRNYDSAVSLLKKIYNNYGNDILADNALYKAARIYQRQLNDEQKAKKLYEQLVTDYSGSIYQLKARKAYRKLRGDRIN
jgi:tetratricopeptide (TPR) repeat protein